MTTTAVADPSGPPGTEPPGAPGDVSGTADARTPLGLFAAVLVFLGTVAYSPTLNYQSWTPKAALLLPLLAVGWPLLIRSRRSPLRPAVLAAVAFVAIAALSTVFAVNHTLAVFGIYGWGTGLLFVATLPAAWALGANLDETGRRDVRLALVVGVVLNVVVAALTVRFDLSFARLTQVESRPPGLWGGPIPFAQLLATAVGLLAGTFALHLRWTMAFAAVVAAGVELSGSRFVFALLLAAIVWVAVRAGLKSAAVLVVCLAAGIGAGALVGHATGSASASSRVTGSSSSSGVTTRLHHWQLAAQAVADRPVLGSGPGTFAAATGRHRTLDVARSEGADRIFADAHNLVVEYATTTGIAGCAAFLAFLALAIRRVRGWAAAAALALFAIHLVEPQQIFLTPLLFLLAGIATPAVGAAVEADGAPGEHAYTRRERVATAALLVPALALSGVLLFADFQLHQSDLDFTLSQSRTAQRLLPRWKEPAALMARNHLYRGITEQRRSDFFESERWREEAAAREPTDAQVWSNLGGLRLRLSQFDRRELDQAERAFERALTVNPQSVVARIGLAQVYLTRDDDDAARRVLEAALAREPEGRNREIVLDLLAQAG